MSKIIELQPREINSIGGGLDRAALKYALKTAASTFCGCLFIYVVNAAVKTK